VDVAVILVSAGAGAAASILTAYVTYRMTARQDQKKWRAELAEKYALLVADQPRAAQALARQFAVGVLIVERGDTALREKVFIAPYTRMTAGRSDDNEIVLRTIFASKHHFAISADGANAYIDRAADKVVLAVQWVFDGISGAVGLPCRPVVEHDGPKACARSWLLFVFAGLGGGMLSGDGPW
jgi:hypothetical protein